MDFAERYGPWAVIAGASDGTGREYARKLAARGVPSVLISIDREPLEALVDEIRAESGVQCVPVVIDLARPDALRRIAEAVGDREVGLFISNAGSDWHGSHFLDVDMTAWLALIQRNVVTMTECCHHFAGPMRTRGRGGLLLVNSGACYGGASYLGIYSASKAFTLCLAESLWGELHPADVDVLTLAMGITDTPGLRAMRSEKGLPIPPGAASCDEVAEVGLARLPHGPVHNWGLEDDEAGYAGTSAAGRRARVLAVERGSKAIFGREG